MQSSRFLCAALALLGAGLLLSSCTEQKEPEQLAQPAEPETPPDLYQVEFETSKGDFVIEVHRDWAPRGADHFFRLVKGGFYDGVRFHRVIRRYIVQWGINGNPKTQSLYANLRIQDDPVKQSNVKGTVSFAKLGPHSRTTQVFINLRDNSALDKDGFAPFGKVTEGMDVVERLWSSYGEVAPRGTGPDPTRIEIEGEAYLAREFPRLDVILKATVIHREPAAASPGDATAPN